MITILYKFAKKYWIIRLAWVNFMLCNIYLNTAVKKKKIYRVAFVSLEGKVPVSPYLIKFMLSLTNITYHFSAQNLFIKTSSLPTKWSSSMAHEPLHNIFSIYLMLTASSHLLFCTYIPRDIFSLSSTHSLSAHLFHSNLLFKRLLGLYFLCKFLLGLCQ